MVLVVLILEPSGRNQPVPEPIFHINLEPGTNPYIQKGWGPRFSRVGTAKRSHLIISVALFLPLMSFVPPIFHSKIFNEATHLLQKYQGEKICAALFSP
ncbi:hypothetical protein Hanom_Chr04g00322171 [Helianthus anomalus]